MLKIVEFVVYLTFVSLSNSNIDINVSNYAETQIVQQQQQVDDIRLIQLASSPTAAKIKITDSSFKVKTSKNNLGIFAQAFNQAYNYARSSVKLKQRQNPLNLFDEELNKRVRYDTLLHASTEVDNLIVATLPRQISKDDSTIKLADVKLLEIFKRNQNYQKLFGVNLNLDEENLNKKELNNRLAKIFKNEKEQIQKTLGRELFINKFALKLENFIYYDKKGSLKTGTLYVNVLKDFYALVNDKNRLYDVGVYSVSTFCDIFNTKSLYRNITSNELNSDFVPFNKLNPQNLLNMMLESLENSNVHSFEFQFNQYKLETQMSQFLDVNGTVDIVECINELERRARAVGNYDYTCSIERFKLLASESGGWMPYDVQGAREAMAVLQGEAEGLYTNARRVFYGFDETGYPIKALDFRVDGLGKYQTITHVEVKNLVSQDLLQKNALGSPPASIQNQSIRLGERFAEQVRRWTDPSNYGILDLTNIIPSSSGNILCLIDLMDVRLSEMPQYKKYIFQVFEEKYPNLQKPVFLQITR